MVTRSGLWKFVYHVLGLRIDFLRKKVVLVARF